MHSPLLLFLVFIVLFLLLLFSGWAISFSMGASAIVAYILLTGSKGLGNFAVLGYNAMSNYNLLALPIFVLMGELLLKGGVAGKLYDAVLPFMERFTGGLVHTNVVANVILGACTGSTIAATTAMSSVSIPELEKRGYAKEICYGSLSSAGCLAALIPPSVGMILFASITSVSLGELFIAGIIPGLILAACFILVAAVWIKKDPKLVPSTPTELMPIGKAIIFALKNLWPLFILIVAVLGTIYFGIGTPTEAGCFGVIGAVILGKCYKQLDKKSISNALVGTAKISGTLLLIIAMASIYGFTLNALGLKTWLLTLLSGLPGHPIFQMFLIWLIYLVLGMFVDSAALIIITTPIFLPFSMNLGFHPVWFGVFQQLAVQLGNITPPVGVTLFAVQATTGDSIKLIAKGAFPFWIAFLIASNIVTIFPILATWLPSMGFG